MSSNAPPPDPARTDPGTPRLGLKSRATVLFVNFFLIILAYYHVKPASRSLFVEYLGADRLPYVWIATAITLVTLIGVYHRLVERHSRLRVVLGTCLTFIVLLIGFRVLLGGGSGVAAAAFYIFVDIFSVVLVEQFWSLTNTVYRTEEGKRWYGFVGTGGLVGGVVAGEAAARLLEHTAMTTVDLLLVSAAILTVIFAVNLWMSRVGVYAEVRDRSEASVIPPGSWRVLLESRYLLLIAAMLLLSQFAQPIVEFQFIKAVEIEFTVLDERTVYLNRFFAVLGLVSIAVNLVLTPLVHRSLGIFAGLLAQPLLLCLFSFAFWLQPVLMTAAAMKVSDRGLSYSINRASKELLYIPVDPVHTYQAKAWIDMLGYRLFKVLGSLVILLLTEWLPLRLGVAGLSWVTVAVCVVWLGVVAMMAREYRAALAAPQPA